MALNKLSKIKKIRLTIFLFGLLVTTLGWAVDNATNIPIILKTISPNYVKVSEVFSILDIGENEKVPISYEGSRILLEWWEPKPPDELLEVVTFISRSTARWNILNNIHSYELRLSTGNEGEKHAADYNWESNGVILNSIQDLIF